MCQSKDLPYFDMNNIYDMIQRKQNIEYILID